jgi:membrane protein
LAGNAGNNEKQEPSPGETGIAPLLYAAVARLFADEALPLAGNIAYRTLLSTFPFLIFLASLASLFGDSTLATRTVDFLLSVAPDYIVKPLSQEIHNVLSIPQRGVFTAAFFVTIWSAMGGVDSIRVCLNRAYDIRENRSIVTIFLISLVFVVVGALALLVVAVLLIIAPIVLGLLQEHLPESAVIIRQLDNIRYPLAVVLLTALLLIFHLVLPAGRRRLSEVWPGVVLTVVLWVLMAVAYRYYLAMFPMFTTTYAGLGGVVAAMFFLYLASIVLIFGGELNRVLMLRREARSRVPLPQQRRG